MGGGGVSIKEGGMGGGLNKGGRNKGGGGGLNKGGRNGGGGSQ